MENILLSFRNNEIKVPPMDIVDFEEMGIIEGSGECGTDSPQIVFQDGSISIDQGDLATYDNGVTYVSIPNFLEVVQDGNLQNVSYMINNNQISVLNGAIVLNPDSFVEIADVTEQCNTEIQKEFSRFLAPPVEPEVINGIKLEVCESNSTNIDNKSSIRLQHPPSDRPIFLTCDTCNLRFTSWKMYKKHKLKHIDEKPFKCSICCKGFNYESNLNLHIATHNVNNPYCPVCKKKFNRLAGLKAHIMLHEREESLFCNECGEEFNSHDYLRKHMATEHRSHEKGALSYPPEVFPCQRCDKVYGTKADRREHLLRFHKLLDNRKAKKIKTSHRRKNRCESCNKCFDKPSQLDRHKRIHTGERPYECNICKRAFNQKGSLHIHMLKHTREKPFACQHCNASFSQKGNLQAHIKRLHTNAANDDRTFRCQMCPCVFKKLGSLNGHFAKAHADCVSSEDTPSGSSMSSTLGSSGNTDSSNKENEDAKAIAVTPQNYIKEGIILDHKGFPRKLETLVCTYCSAEFAKPGELLKHVRTHDPDKPYKCIICSKSFPLQSNLTLHMESHTEAKEFCCSYCQLRFSTIRSLRDHQKTHTSGTVTSNEKEIEDLMVAAQQSITNGSGSSSSNIILTENGNIVDMTDDVKVLVVKKDKTYKCVDCNIEFKQKTHHRAHMQMHKLSYNCTLCPRTFHSKNTLQVHLKSHAVQKYTCGECKKEFTSESALKDHEEIHVTGFDWSCPVCSMIFPSMLLCKKHILSGHPKMSKMPPIKQAKTKGIEVEDPKGNVPIGELSLSVVLPSEEVEPSADITDLIPALEPNRLYVIGNSDGSISFTPLPSKEIPSSIEIDGFPCQSPSNTSQTPVFQGNSDGGTIFGLEAEDDVSAVVNIGNTNTMLSQNELSRCDECDIIFATASDLFLHRASHSQEKTYSCSHCNKLFITAEECEKHTDTHYCIQEVFQCSVCSQTFQTEEECKEHLEKCPNPQENSSENKKLRSNWRGAARVITEEEAKVISAIEPEDVSSISEQVFIKCLREKGKLQKPQEEAKSKVIVHPHKCKYCPKSFKKPSDLVRHIRTHTGERPYECSYCNKRFSIKTTAESHMKTHTKEKAYGCYVCSKPFSTIGSLKVHMRLHTGHKPFSCPLCDAQFRTSGHKKTHLLKHAKEKSASTIKANNDSNKNTRVKKIDKCLEYENLIESATTLKANNDSDKDTCVKQIDKCLEYDNLFIEAEECIQTPASVLDGTPYIISMSLPNDSTKDLLKNGEDYFSSSGASNASKGKSRRDSKVLLNISDEGGGNGETPKYFLSIKDGSTGEDGFLVETLNENEIVVTITKGNALLDQSSKEKDDIVSECHERLECYSCNECKKLFTSQIQLDKHIQKCQSGKIYQCSVCPEKFDRKSDLDLHSLGHELDQVFSCSACAETFPLEEQLRSHKCKESPLDISLDNDLFLFPHV